MVPHLAGRADNERVVHLDDGDLAEPLGEGDRIRQTNVLLSVYRDDLSVNDGGAVSFRSPLVNTPLEHEEQPQHSPRSQTVRRGDPVGHT